MSDKTQLQETSQNKLYSRKHYRTLVLLLLTLIYAFNFIDRQIIGILSPFIQADLNLTNTQMGLLKGFLFAIFYTAIGIPIAWLADRYNRTNIITISLAIWSGFTALTGLASNFMQIAIARVGVGIGEAGGSPPSHSMISDMYPKEKRSSVLAIYSLGIPLGQGFAYFFTGIARGNPDVKFDWQQLLITLGVSGVLLAILARLVIREPMRGLQDVKKPTDKEAPPPFSLALKTLVSIPSWWLMCFGLTAGSFVAYAAATWQIDYLVPFDSSAPEGARYGFKSMMFTLAALNLTAYALGTYLGGKITDRLAKRSIRYYGIVPAVTLLISLPLLLAAYWAPSVTLHMVFVGLFLFFVGMYLGPCFAIAQTLAPINMRAMSTAIFFLVINLIALGGGPTLVGILADHFEPDYGKIVALRYSLGLTSLAFLVSIGCFLYAAKTLPKDWAEAEARNESA